jgi:hypothetical protein
MMILHYNVSPITRILTLLFIVLSSLIIYNTSQVLCFRPHVSIVCQTTTKISVPKQQYPSNCCRYYHGVPISSRVVVHPPRPSQLYVSVEGDFTTTTAAMTEENTNSKRSIKSFARAFYKFCRPHTIRGTILASIAGTTRALLDTPGAFGKKDDIVFIIEMI